MNKCLISSPQYKMLGVNVNPLSIDSLNYLLEAAVSVNDKVIISGHNLHSIYIAHRNPNMHEFYRKADYVRIDGMPLILIGKILGYPFEREQRVTYMDWIMPLMQLATEKQWRVFYLGSAPGVAVDGADVLKQDFPDLQIMTVHGYFDPTTDSDENNKVIETINAYRPDILMVGMGMPRQELWLNDNLEKLNAKVILTCGACMDYIAGVIPTPPRWMGRIGLEWLYRLVSEPKRLWKRYLVEPWFLGGLLLRDLWELRIKNVFGGGNNG